MVNDDLYNIFSNSLALAASLLLSDHAPIWVTLGEKKVFYHKSFKHFNSWCNKNGYMEIVARGWSSLSVLGCPMYKLTCKHKMVKAKLNKWAKEVGLNPSRKVLEVKEHLKSVQRNLAKDPLCISFLVEEGNAMNIYYEVAKHEEESIMLQSCTTWLKCGDRNKKFFHTMHRVRNNSKTITTIKDKHGGWILEQLDIL